MRSTRCKPTSQHSLGELGPEANTRIRHLILAYNTSIQVYSAADSLLLRKIPLQPLIRDGGGQIVSVRLSLSSPNFVWVASSTGYIWLIDWTNSDGSEKDPFKLNCGILCDMTVERMSIGKDFGDVPFVSIENKGNWQIVVCDVRDSRLRSTKALLSQEVPVLDLQSVRNGYAIVGSVERNIMLGTLRPRLVNSIQDLDYEFITLDCNDAITCLDVRAADRIHLNKKSQAQAGDEPVVDIVVGCARGAVLFYNDLLPHIRWASSSKGHRSSLQPRKYHWHRKAVHAVKWSRDGERYSPFLVVKV